MSLSLRERELGWGWALIKFFCLQDGRLFEMGANSGLGAYSNKYGISIQRVRVVPYFLQIAGINLRLFRLFRGDSSGMDRSSSAKCILYSDVMKGESSPTGRGGRSRDEKGNQGVGDIRFTKKYFIPFFYSFLFFNYFTLSLFFYTFFTHTHTHDPRPLPTTHDPRHLATLPWGQCLTRPVPTVAAVLASDWCQKTLSAGAFLAVLYFSSFHIYFPARLDFPSPPLSAPGSPRMLSGKVNTVTAMPYLE